MRCARSRASGCSSCCTGEYDGTDRGIDVQVWRLRRILETDPSTPRFIQTVRGRGYVFVPDGEAHAQTH